MADPLVVDKWHELSEAKRWATKAQKAAGDEEEVKRCWRHFFAHWRASLTGEPPDLHPEQRKLLT